MKNILFILTLITGFNSLAQDYKVQFKVKGTEDSTVYLIRYQADKAFYADTAKADKTGLATFKSKWANKPGMYGFMTSDQKRFEVLLNKEDVLIETDVRNFVGAMNVKKSEENKKFYEYIKYIGSQRSKAGPIQAILNDSTATEEKKESAKKEKEAIDKNVLDFQNQLIKENPNLLATKMIKAQQQIVVPDAPKDENGVITDSLFQRNYYITHYWDNFDLKEDGLNRMQVYYNALNQLFDKVLIKNQDSLVNYAFKFIDKLDPKSEIFKETVVYITSKYQNSKIMCLDGVFVRMVLKYYKGGLATWMTESKNKEIVERAEAMAPNMCNLYPHNVGLQDSLDNWPRLYDVKKDYTILIFWAADCGHCKKEMPKLIERYNLWKKDGLNVEVYAVASDANQEWRDFIKKEKLEWINVGVPQKAYSDTQYATDLVRSGKSDYQSLNYHKTFDIYKTPTIFVLDKDKKIIGKNLETEGLDKFIRRLIKDKR